MKPKRWRVLFLVAVVALATVLAAYLTVPLSSPNVSLKFNGFTVRRTNIFAVICLTNHGPKMIWWNSGIDWELEAETPRGWVTNEPVRFSWAPHGVASSSNDIFWVDVPSDAIRWKVHGYFDHYNRHHVRLEFVEWLFASGYAKRIPGVFLEGTCWLLSLLPEPSKQWGEVSSEYLTNRPPAEFRAPAGSDR